MTTSVRTGFSGPTVLLTGFGPFPGMPINISSTVAKAVADRARIAWPGHRFHTAILPTEWQAAPERVATLLHRLRPVLALHFGVAKDADGFRLETRGLNVCRMTADAAGQLPTAPTLIPHGPDAYDCDLPVDRIVARLRAVGLPVSISHDAGGYLCNSVFYQSLHRGAGEATPRRACFIHLPSTLAAPHLTFDGAVTGSIEILRLTLDG